MPTKATGKRRIGPLAMMEGQFLEDILPLQAFATLTMPCRVSELKLNGMFSEWVQAVQSANRLTLGWIKTLELAPSPHIHAALIAVAPLNCVNAESLWRTKVRTRRPDAAKVELYINDLAGLGYILKRLGSSREEPECSDNVLAFASGRGDSLFRTNSAQRRQFRRIRAELERRSLTALEGSRLGE